MTLGEIIKDYRISHQLSQRQFAGLAGLSNGFISILEDGVNPKTRKPVKVSLENLRKISKAMGIQLHELFAIADDIEADIRQEDEPTQPVLGAIDELDIQIINLLQSLSPEKKKAGLDYLRYLADNSDKQ